MDDVEYVYLYRTGRDDGMEFCVGATFRDGHTDGMVALFGTYFLAERFMTSMRSLLGEDRVMVMPSAQVGS